MYEDLADICSTKELSLRNVAVLGSKPNFYIMTKFNEAIKPQMTLCLVPMLLYDEVFNTPDSCAFVPIKKITDTTISFIAQRRFKKDYLYHVDFVSPRTGVRASMEAIATLKDNELEEFFTTLDKKLPAYARMEKLKETSFESFEWCNESIGNNKEQQLVIKNIINCTAFPFPFVVFGPPGELKIISRCLSCFKLNFQAREKHPRWSSAWRRS